jgi:hypothetical protein
MKYLPTHNLMLGRTWNGFVNLKHDINLRVNKC